MQKIGVKGLACSSEVGGLEMGSIVDIKEGFVTGYMLLPASSL